MASDVGVRDVDVTAHRSRSSNPAIVYGCKIGDDCFVGAFYRDPERGGESAHVPVCNRTPSAAGLVTIGEDCFVGHGVMFVNDTFSVRAARPADSKELWRET